MMKEKPWREYTEEEILANNRKYCNHCKYQSNTHQSDKNKSTKGVMCGYLLKTGHSRGCSPIDCEKFEPKKRRSRND